MFTLDTLKKSFKNMNSPLSCVVQKAIFSAWAFLDIYAKLSSGHYPQGLRGFAIAVGLRSCIP